MKQFNSNNKLAQGAIIAALYVALTYAQALIFPGSTSMAVQFRISEMMTLLAVFTPAAIPGLTIGCAIANLVALGALPLDVFIGSFATFLATVFMYKCRNICFKGLPLLACLMPAIFNGIIIGWEIELFFIEGPFNFVSFMIQGGLVALGELGVCFTLGLIFVHTIKSRGLEKYFK